MHRILSLSLVVLALALFVTAPAWAQQAQPNPANPNRANPAQANPNQANPAQANQGQMEGKFVKAEGANQFVMTDRNGKNEHTHTLAPNAMITCDGKTCRLSDLKDGTHIRVTTDPNNRAVVTRVDASTQERDREKNK